MITHYERPDRIQKLVQSEVVNKVNIPCAQRDGCDTIGCWLACFYGNMWQPPFPIPH